MRLNLFPFLLTAGLLRCVFAHPGHNVAEEAAERRDFVKRNPRSLQACSEQLNRRGHTADALSRRQTAALNLRTKRDLVDKKPVLHPRDLSTSNSTHVSGKDVGLGSDETLLFADNSSCVLQPEVTEGPYYVAGELIRHNLVEEQEGLPLFIDIQIIDTTTCEPIPALYMDFWHCNATGVYSGISSNGNGNSNDTSNIDATFLRGIQQTDVNGVVQFETIFPGHYTGRATHIHILTHNPNNTVIRTNSTLLNETTHASHVGQLFFDQDLISLVEAEAPYALNTQVLTTNAEDDILSAEADGSSDPFVQYVLLGDNISDGILAWVTVGIDPTGDREVNAAATLYEDGGVANENAENGPGGDGGLPPDSAEATGDGPSGAPEVSATVA